MITDDQTNYLYLADILPKKYPDFFSRFEKVLKDRNISYDFLPRTKDVWAVDYMPVQVESNKFVRFMYRPDYLMESAGLQATISDVDAICEDIGVKTIKSDIILDGGNLIKSTKKVIMTDRIFSENPIYERKQLINELYNLLEVDNIYFVPEQPGDYTGHADGMVRFLDENTVIINDFSREKETFYRSFEIAIHNAGLNCVRIPYNVYGNPNMDCANGVYINYLQIADNVFVPIFGLKEDYEAVKRFEELFPGNTITTVESNELANDEGVLNCITWNILKN